MWFWERTLQWLGRAFSINNLPTCTPTQPTMCFWEREEACPPPINFTHLHPTRSLQCCFESTRRHDFGAFSVGKQLVDPVGTAADNAKSAAALLTMWFCEHMLQWLGCAFSIKTLPLCTPTEPTMLFWEHSPQWLVHDPRLVANLRPQTAHNVVLRQTLQWLVCVSRLRTPPICTTHTAPSGRGISTLWQSQQCQEMLCHHYRAVRSICIQMRPADARSHERRAKPLITLSGMQ